MKKLRVFNLYIAITAVLLIFLLGLSLYNYGEWKAVHYEREPPTYIEIASTRLLTTSIDTVERSSFNLFQSSMSAAVLAFFLAILFWVRALICKEEKDIAQAI